MLFLRQFLTTRKLTTNTKSKTSNAKVQVYQSYSQLVFFLQ